MEPLLTVNNGEHLGHVERSGKETFDFTRTGHRSFWSSSDNSSSVAMISEATYTARIPELTCNVIVLFAQRMDGMPSNAMWSRSGSPAREIPLFLPRCTTSTVSHRGCATNVCRRRVGKGHPQERTNKPEPTIEPAFCSKQYAPWHRTHVGCEALAGTKQQEGNTAKASRNLEPALRKRSVSTKEQNVGCRIPIAELFASVKAAATTHTRTGRVVSGRRTSAIWIIFPEIVRNDNAGISRSSRDKIVTSRVR